MKNIRLFFSEIFQFLEVKFSIRLNRRVFAMTVRLHCVDILYERKGTIWVDASFYLLKQWRDITRNNTVLQFAIFFKSALVVENHLCHNT